MSDGDRRQGVCECVVEVEVIQWQDHGREVVWCGGADENQWEGDILCVRSCGSGGEAELWPG